MGKYAITFTEPSMTKQSFKDECDINQIMAKYQKTGLITHIKKFEGEYGEYDPIDFTTAMQTIAEGQSMFEELPSQARKYFDNDPSKFMEFVQNPDNVEKMKELGLGYEMPKTKEPKAELSPKAPETASEPNQADSSN